MKITNISIISFYGRNIEIKIQNNLLILVGENGSGKTTLLRFLYFFLAKQWNRLNEFKFYEVQAEINGKNYILKKQELGNDIQSDPIKLENLALKYPAFSNFILKVLPDYFDAKLINDSFTINKISQTHDVPPSLIIAILKNIFESRFNASVFDWESSIIFLPTYRKIEKGIDILMGDIDKRIYSYILETVPFLKEIINEEKDQEIESLLENDINKIFSKINDERNLEKWFKKQNMGIELLEFGMKDVQVRIAHFISVFKDSKHENLLKFKSVLNKYLGNNKRVEIDENGLVVVKLQDNSTFDLEFLSSGEKQIVSIFSYIYFSINGVFIIIDEPELSLSIKWQEFILEDLVNSSTGVICATHSPFIISNNFHKNTSGINELSR